MSGKIKIKHTEKKSQSISGERSVSSELFPMAKETKPIDGQWATAAQLFAVTGLDDAALRRLANPNNPNPATGAAWIPKPRGSKYEILPTIKGLIAWLRHQIEQASNAETIYANMEAFARATGISRGLMKEMKADRCPGFHPSGRINLFEWLGGLEAWLSGKTDNDAYELRAEKVSSYSEMREKYQARNEKKKNEELNQTSMSKTVAIEVMMMLRTIHFEGYDRQLQELPALLAGKPAASIRKQLAKYIAEIKAAESNTIGELQTKAAQQEMDAREQGELVSA